MLDYLTFIKPEWIATLWQTLRKISGERARELTRLADLFGNVELLARYYVEPNCQNDNPADFDEEEPVPYVTTPVFRVLNTFFNREFKVSDDGRSQMFILADAGMGKTSLLAILKLTHLMSFWPKKYKCELLKIGPSTDTDIERIEDKNHTILLLDALDEDPSAWGYLDSRLARLLALTTNFRRTVITCRTQFFPREDVAKIGVGERIAIGGFRCPVVFLSLFDELQVDQYLQRRFSAEEYAGTHREKIASATRILVLCL